MHKSSSYRTSKPAYSGPSVQGPEQEPFFAQTKEESFFQPKLTVGERGDKYEKEADAVADKVISKKEMDEEPAIQRQEISSIQRLATPEEDENFPTNDQRMRRDRELREKPEVQLKCAHCEEEEKMGVQTKPGSVPGSGSRVASESLTSRIDGSRGKGSPLPADTLSEMQSSFGRDLSGVNIHTDAESVGMNRELGAQAFTHGSDIYFNTGKFNPSSSDGKHLLAHEITHVVQQGAAGRGIQTKPHSHHKHASAPKPEPVFFRNNEGALFSDAAMGDDHRVGISQDGKQFIFVDRKGDTTSAENAAVGRVRLKGAGTAQDSTIVRIMEVTATGVADQPGSVHLQRHGHAQPVVFDPANQRFSDKLLSVSQKGSISPAEFDKLPADTRSGVGEGSIISLSNGQAWTLMSFHKHGETSDTARWVPARSTKAQQKVMTDQGENLPDNLKTDIEPELTTLGVVSTIEGGFGSTSGGAASGDIMASLGIFQWGMLRNKKDASSSLAMFFRNLKDRASEAQKTRAKDRTDEQKLYIDAWAACAGKHLDIDKDGFITLNGNRATGGEVETAMHGVLGSDTDLRTYQLVAAHDWITEFKSHTVWPGATGKGRLGKGYSPGNEQASFEPDDEHKVVVTAPDNTSTVGDFLSSEKAVANAIMLGVNRPAWVQYSLWRALDAATDPKEKTKDLLKTLMDSMPKPAVTPHHGKKGHAHPKHKKKITIDKAAATAAGPEALAAYTALQAFIFPPTHHVDSEDTLVQEFQRQALVLYPTADINKYHRERRFSTVEGAFNK
ncbi:MAG: DUF4157 domain-containing protein [Bacteroidetes bacterium]|nr:DUF4157 domain-containing protein [Bacteroidota bacterium]